MSDATKQYPVCPICSNYIPNNQHPGAYPGAISRRDNKTEICSTCGVNEALDDFVKSRAENFVTKPL